MTKRRQHHEVPEHHRMADETSELVWMTTNVVKAGVVLNAGSAMMGMIGNIRP